MIKPPNDFFHKLQTQIKFEESERLKDLEDGTYFATVGPWGEGGGLYYKVDDKKAAIIYETEEATSDFGSFNPYKGDFREIYTQMTGGYHLMYDIDVRPFDVRDEPLWKEK